MVVQSIENIAMSNDTEKCQNMQIIVKMESPYRKLDMLQLVAMHE